MSRKLQLQLVGAGLVRHRPVPRLERFALAHLT